MNANKGRSKLEDVFGIDLDKIQLDTESYLIELGMELEDAAHKEGTVLQIAEDPNWDVEALKAFVENELAKQ